MSEMGSFPAGLLFGPAPGRWNVKNWVESEWQLSGMFAKRPVEAEILGFPKSQGQLSVTAMTST